MFTQCSTSSSSFPGNEHSEALIRSNIESDRSFLQSAVLEVPLLMQNLQCSLRNRSNGERGSTHTQVAQCMDIQKCLCLHGKATEHSMMQKKAGLQKLTIFIYLLLSTNWCSYPQEQLQIPWYC